MAEKAKVGRYQATWLCWLFAKQLRPGFALNPRDHAPQTIGALAGQML
jgi:hypothetical protein